MAGVQMNMRATKRWRTLAKRLAKRRGLTWSQFVRMLVHEEAKRIAYTMADELL